MKDKQQRSAGINIGSVSLIMVFAVLALTVFAVLSLVTATNELRLAKKFALSVENYYNADYEACVAVEKIKKNIENNEPVKTDENILKNTLKKFSVPIDDRQSLKVTVEVADGKIKILSWQSENTEAENYDNSMPVWTGDEGVLQ